MSFSKYKEQGDYHWRECDRNSPYYNPPLEAKYKIILKYVKKAKRILDIGCGDGYLTSLLAPLCGQVIGIDYDLTGIKIAFDKLKNVSTLLLIRADCYNLPFKNEYFDFVVLSDVIEHLKNPEVCLKEIKRILSSDGMFLLTTPKWRNDRWWDKEHVKEYRIEELVDLLSKYFTFVSLSFFWPLKWSRIYSSRLGWRLIKILSRHFFNPFLKEGKDSVLYGQILAICRN